MQPVTVTTSDLDQARAVLGRHFYSNFVDVLSPAAGWQARFDVVSAGAAPLGDLHLGADVRIDFGELGAYHVDVPLAGRLAWHQGGAQASLMHHPLIGQSLQDSLVTGLLLATDHQYRTQLDSRRQLTAAPRAVRRAAEAMHAEPERPFTMTDLA